MWGLFHGFFSTLEEYVPFTKKLPKQVAYIYTMLVVCVGFVIFRADTLTHGMYIISQMFLGFSFNDQSMSFVINQLTPWFITMVLAGIIGMAPIKLVTDLLWKVDNCHTEMVLWKHKAVRAFFSQLP